jgi:peroxisomal coenzyme A diphosphatase NUDT7
VHSSNEPSIKERIAWALLNRKVFKDACEKESIDLRFAKKIVEGFERRHGGGEEEKRRTRKTKGKL